MKVQPEESPEIRSACKRICNHVTKSIQISTRDYYNGLIKANIEHPSKTLETTITALDKNIEIVSINIYHMSGVY